MLERMPETMPNMLMPKIKADNIDACNDAHHFDARNNAQHVDARNDANHDDVIIISQLSVPPQPHHVDALRDARHNPPK